MLLKKSLPVLLILSFLIAPAAFGEQPLTTLKQSIDQALGILKDPQFQDPNKKQQLQEQVWAHIRNVFDYDEIAKRSLARNWKKFSAVQRQEFIDVFSELLRTSYISKIDAAYQDVQVDYLDEEFFSETKALVKTKMTRQGTEIAVDYKMKQRLNTWRIYDVVIEGMSLASNYRKQFHRFLMKESPDKLIAVLKQKVAKQKKAGTA